MPRSAHVPATVAFLLLTLSAACGGGGGEPAPAGPGTPGPGAQGVEVRVEPPSAEVAAGGSVAFDATVTGSAVTDVVWSVTGSGCGAVTSSGLYTAPGAAATCNVVATSTADATRSATAVVTVTAPPPPPPTVAVSVSPASSTVSACRSVTLRATVTGATDTSVTWSVQEGAAGGTITSAGVYTAPTSEGTYHAVATSRADPARSAIATLTVRDEVLSVAVTPTTVTVAPGGTAQLTATVTTTCGTFTSTRTLLSNGAVVGN